MFEYAVFESLPYVPVIRRLAQALNLPAYLVGGVVRDVLLDRSPGDIDFTVEGDAPALARAVALELGGTVTVHSAFRTATWASPAGLLIDFATARAETYPRPAALPVVAPASIQEDLRRRDFTINALAWPLAPGGELLDPYQGRRDLAERRLRVLHRWSFVDDPTRIFRGVRYEQRLGFNLALDTLARLPEAWSALAALTAERVGHEFELIFGEPLAAAMLARLNALEVLARVQPALRWEAGCSQAAELIPTLPLAEWKLAPPPAPAPFYLALLVGSAPAEPAAQALRRLNASRESAGAVQAALTLNLAGATPSELTRQLERLSLWGVAVAYLLYPERRAVLHAYLSEWRFVRAATTGNDLIARGLTPGPAFKPLLWKLRAARLDGAVRSPADEQLLLGRLLAEAGRSS